MLRSLIASGRTIDAIGATDALSAKLIESHGFDCVYIGSYATAASRFGLPDTGALSLPELVEQARTIVNAVKLPVIADAEGGFHDAANIWRTVQAFEQAGVAAIHIEDHAYGKHAAVEQKLRPAAEAAARIRAAVEARQDADFLIVARSDAFWVAGDLEDTIARLRLFVCGSGRGPGVPDLRRTGRARRGAPPRRPPGDGAADERSARRLYRAAL